MVEGGKAHGGSKGRYVLGLWVGPRPSKWILQYRGDRLRSLWAHLLPESQGRQQEMCSFNSVSFSLSLPANYCDLSSETATGFSSSITLGQIRLPLHPLPPLSKVMLACSYHLVGRQPPPWSSLPTFGCTGGWISNQL